MSSESEFDIPDIEFGTVALLIIPATNIYRAQVFYSEVFGWSFKRMTPTSTDRLRVFFQKGSFRGYFVEVPKDKHVSDAKPDSYYYDLMVPIHCFAVENIDETATLINKAGGQLLEKYKNSSIKRNSAMCQDTEGNIFDIMSKDEKDGFENKAGNLGSRRVPDRGAV